MTVRCRRRRPSTRIKVAGYHTHEYQLNITPASHFISCSAVIMSTSVLADRRRRHASGGWHWRIQGANPTMVLHPVYQWDLVPQPAKKLCMGCWGVGQFMVHMLCACRIAESVCCHQACFQESKWSKMRLVGGAPLRTPLGELTTPQDPLAGLRGGQRVR